ncbi:hypothetical protein J7L48_00670 [bacterium]|nr:hypothetical protein [bacterium]
MKKILFFVFLAVFTPIIVHSHGIGLVGGYPGGLVFRWDMQKSSAVDLYLDYYWGDFAIAGDFVLKKDMKLGEFPIQLFYGGGIGAMFYTYNDYVYDSYYIYGHIVKKTYIYPSIRAKVGASYFIQSMPVEIFIEMGPSINIGEYINLIGFHGGAGFRYRF